MFFLPLRSCYPVTECLCREILLEEEGGQFLLSFIWHGVWGVGVIVGFYNAAVESSPFYGDWSMFWTALVMLSSVGLIFATKALLQPSELSSRGVATELDKARDEAFQRAMEARAERRGIEQASFSRKKPDKLFDLSPEIFEDYCKDWCLYLGYPDATKTRNTKDGGVDIRSSEIVAQVKFQELPVGVKPIRELFGLASSEGKAALFFSYNGYSREAVAEAKKFKVQLWIVRPFEGKIYRPNDSGNHMNQGDYHSGPEGYSANTGYQDTYYGSNSQDERD